MNINSIFNSEQDYLIFFLRLVLGIVIFPHGTQKLFDWSAAVA